MKLSNAEKLTLVMLADIQQHLNLRGEVDPAFVKTAIINEHTWSLSWQYPGLFGNAEEPTPPEVKEAVDFLDMWDFIETAHEALSPEDKARVETEAAPFGKHVRFPGFDGNHECEHYSAALHLVEEMNKFSRFKGRNLNSHASLVPNYQRMLAVFEPIRATLTSGDPMNADQLIAILQAKRHPGT